jgi:hypothetical protein
MSVNRAFRRQQERQQIRDWKQAGQYNQVLRIQRNGITQQDLDKAYDDGYKAGYMFSATNFFKQMYASIAKELHESGNNTEGIVSFLHNVDRRFAVMFDADEEIEDVFNLIGIRMNIQSNSIDRINEVIIHE